jgi:Carbohydrate binding module (family 6)
MQPPTHLPIPLHRPPRLIPGRRAVVAAIGAVGALLAAMVTSLAFTASSSATTVPGPPSGWTTTYSDAFSGSAGSQVDSGWTYDTGTQYNGTGCTANYGTGEVESNTSSTANVSEDGSGHLNITPVNSGGSWTSGRIETVSDSFAAPAGGEMEVSTSIKQPNPSSGLGYWPAFWMLGAGFRASGAGTSGTMDCANWPSTGEIDMMEDVNALSEHSGTLHCGTDPGGPCNETTGLGSGLQACSGCQTGYNTYSVIVNRTNTSNESITWYLNGTAYYTVTESQVGTATWQAAVDHGFFLILDVAIGGGYPNGVCGCTSPSSSTTSGAAMSVGYVAVYTTTGASASPSPSPTATSTSGSGGGTSCSSTATASISADCYKGSAGSISVTAASGDSNPSGVDGNQVAQLSNGDYLEYPGINFGSGSSQFDARVASGAAGGVSGLVKVVLDNPANTPVGSFAVANTGGWSSWKTVPANISQVTGTHTVYLEFSSGASGNPPFVSLHYFSFPVS